MKSSKKNKNKKTINMLSPTTIKLGNKKDDGKWAYIDHLKQAVENDDGYNIAVSGSYGTGKSSIMKTFAEKSKYKNKVIIISIGSFLKTREDTDNQEKKESRELRLHSEDVDEENTTKISIEEEKKNKEEDGKISLEEEQLLEKIEKSIVKQLIYRTKFSDSKLSSISRPQKSWRLKYLLFSFFISYIILYIFILLSNETINNLLSSSVINFYNFLHSAFSFLPNYPYDFLCPFFNILFIIDCIWLIISTINYLFILTNKAKTKIKIHNYELELDRSDNLSKFSFMDNLYEILYYFMNSNVEIVVFEDIDRYQKDVCIKVIEDLKELNLIINKCYGINHKKIFNKFKIKRNKIVFIYSFRDSIFYEHTQKNKFYDYILSVMPISTTYNSDQNFINEFGNVGRDFKEIDRNLLNKTALHITDMRTIKSIINDYDLFVKILNKNNLSIQNKTQIFALCVFKNYDLKGYDSLSDYDNKIDELIINFGEVISEEIEKDIEKIKGEISSIKKSVHESKVLLLNNNKINYIIPTHIIINDKEYSYEKFISYSFDINLLNNDSIYVKIENVEPQEMSFYEEKSNFIRNIKNKNKIIELKEQEIKHLNNLHTNDDDLFEYSKEVLNKIESGNRKDNEKREKGLIADFVYLGFIRNDYIDFITMPVSDNYFTINDSRFLFSYKKHMTNYFGKIDNPSHIIDYLGEKSLKGSYILNRTIIKYIYERKDKSELIKQFIDINEIHLDFLEQINYSNYIMYRDLIYDLADCFPEIWSKYISKNFQDKKRNIYDGIIVDIALIKKLDLNEIESKDKLIDKIYSCATINHIDFNNKYPVDDSKSKCLLNNLKELNIQFPNISKILNKLNTEETLDIIVYNNLYELNKNNLLAIIYQGNSEINYPLTYSYIENSKYYKNIENKIKENLNSFANTIYLGDENSKFIIGDEKLIQYILEESDNDDLIKEVLNRENFEIKDYYLNPKFFKLAFDNNHIGINWNIINNYSTGSFPEDNNLLKIALENILYFFNKNTNVISRINSQFMNKLIDKLYINKEYNILNTILHNYDTTKLKRINAYVKNTNEELSQKINFNLIHFDVQNYNKIKNKCSLNICRIYKNNWLQAGGYEKLKNEIDEEDLVRSNKYLSADNIVYIINNIYKNKHISKSEIISLMST